MHQYNPYAKDKRVAFMEVMRDINARLENGKQLPADLAES
jgi:hypothetical protein